MFVEAIEKANQYTRPIHFIARYYGAPEIVPSSATLFFVNEEGCAITCRHVAELIVQGEKIYSHFLKFKAEKRQLEKGKHSHVHLSTLEERYKMQKDTLVRVRHNFLRTVSDFTHPTIFLHPSPSIDLAIIKFEEFGTTQYGNPAVFLRDGSKVKQGRTLCRLGYPFPEFTNYITNYELDDIEWTTTGRADSPCFPMDGIVTRPLGDPVTGQIDGIEMSTPGLPGQSGGPLFDMRGIVYGMQASTRHLYLGFDRITRQVLIQGEKRRVSNHPFLNVGQCVHVNVIKDFLRKKSIKFYEAD